MEKGVIEILVQFIVSESALQRNEDKHLYLAYESAVWALGNIAGDDEAAEMAVLGADVPRVIFSHILVPFQNLYNMTRVSIWALSNIVRGSTFPRQAVRNENSRPFFPPSLLYYGLTERFT